MFYIKSGTSSYSAFIWNRNEDSVSFPSLIIASFSFLLNFCVVANINNLRLLRFALFMDDITTEYVRFLAEGAVKFGVGSYACDQTICAVKVTAGH